MIIDHTYDFYIIFTPGIPSTYSSHLIVSTAQLEDTVRELRDGAAHDDKTTFGEWGQISSRDTVDSLSPVPLVAPIGSETSAGNQNQESEQNELIQLGLFEQALAPELKEML